GLALGCVELVVARVERVCAAAARRGSLLVDLVVLAVVVRGRRVLAEGVVAALGLIGGRVGLVGAPVVGHAFAAVVLGVVVVRGHDRSSTCARAALWQHATT